MPFKSKAQRRKFYAMADRGEIPMSTVKRWEEHTGDKKIPERVKQAFLKELESITEEDLRKQAGFFDSAAEWLGDNPGIAALTAGGLVTSGALGRHLVRKAAPATTRAGRRLQQLAKEKGIGITISTHAKGDKVTPGLLTRIKARLRTGGSKPIYATEEGYILRSSAPDVRKGGVTVGVDQEMAASAEILSGGAATRGAKAKRTLKASREIDRGGKLKEVSPEVGVQSAFGRTMGASQVAKKHKIKPPGKSEADKARYLDELQGALKKEYSQTGFVLKPHDQVASSGAFPNQEGKWGEIYKDYNARLKPKMEKLRKDVLANPQNYPAGVSEYNIVAKKFRNDPAYAGTALEGALKDPKRTVGQEFLKQVQVGGKKIEYRVHMVGGEVPDQLAYERYHRNVPALRKIPVIGKLFRGKAGSPTDAADWVRRNVAPKIKGKYREGTYGLDVMRIEKPKGGYDYRLAELNPSTPEGYSGYLDPMLNPTIGQDMHRWLLGKDPHALAAGKALLGGGSVAAGGYGTYKLTRGKGKSPGQARRT